MMYINTPRVKDNVCGVGKLAGPCPTEISENNIDTITIPQGLFKAINEIAIPLNPSIGTDDKPNLPTELKSIA